MRLALTREQEDFRAEVRDYFIATFTPAVARRVERDPVDIPAYRDLLRRFGADGWLCPTWPVELGGRGLTPVEQFIFFDETQRLRVPLPFLSTNTVGPTIAAFGSEEQKQTTCRGSAGRVPVLDRVLRAGVPAPTSRASRPARCVTATTGSSPDRRCGRRSWTGPTTCGSRAAPIRTRPATRASRSSSCRPTPTGSRGPRSTRSAGGLTAATYYEDVRVPVANTVGEVHGGWRLMTSQLNHERIAWRPPGRSSGDSTRSAAGPSRPSSPTAAG
jgi:3-oxocholest-4-en-26-oyl-CoA dehydrogenase alpha subunit